MFVKEIIIIYKELSCPFSHLNHKILKTGKHYFKMQQLEFPKVRELSHDHSASRYQKGARTISLTPHHKLFHDTKWHVSA